jgi:hypothetical protein
VRQGVPAGDHRAGQLGGAVVDHGLEQDEPARLRGGDRDHQRVEQAVTVLADPVTLEGRDGRRQRRVGEETGHIGVRG